MSKKQEAEKERQEWAEKLRRMLKPGSTVDCVLRHVSRSGMQRRIDLYVRTPDGPQFISGMAAAAMGERWDRDKGGIIVGGCGMDMGFHLVYNLGRTLWPDGFGCVGERKKGDGSYRGCPSNDHSNGDRDYTPHQADRRKFRNKGAAKHDHWHKDGGYALRHNWL